MKKNIFSLYSLLVVLGSSLLFLDACKLKNPTEGVVISVKADAVTAPSTLLVRDAKTGSPIASLTSAVPITITGPGAPYVYSSGASKSISLFQGAVLFSLRKGTPVSAANPINFTVNINIPGYIPLEYPITLTSLLPIRREAYLVSFANPPAGAKGETKTVSTGSDGKTTDTISINIPGTPEKTEALKIAIAAGTQMLDATGQPVSGSVEAKVLQFTVGKQESLKSFPGGLTLESLKDANGNALPSGGIEPAGWIDMSMSAGGKSVKSFDKPLLTTIEINKDQINPKTNAKFKAGDELDVYSKTAGEDHWVKEGTSLITLNSTTGNLEATMSIKHLSWWTLGSFIAKCGEPIKLTINIKPNYLSKDFEFYKEGSGGEELFSMSFIEMEDGSGLISKTSTKVPEANSKYYIVSGSDMVYKGILCGTTIDLGSFAAEDLVSFTVDIKCENNNRIILPENYTVHYIDDDIYQNTINTGTDRKIDPNDPPIKSDGSVTIKTDPNGKDWFDTKIGIFEVNGVTYNKITIPKANLTVGKKYRFSIYYNDGSKDSREDYVTDVVTNTDLLNGKTVTVTLSKCPF